ncbi:AraC family transcriptional regulator [Bacillus infantis]|uniref:AraC family transcriptional regulator n=1 Tax=Bacillus infantis TaxID=324767 RepID=UPI003981AC8A
MDKVPPLLNTPTLTSVAKLTEARKEEKNVLHKHEAAEILFIKDGTADFVLNGQTFTVNRGDLLLINSNMEHGILSNVKDHIKGFSLTISKLHLDGLPKGFFIPFEDSPILKVQEYHITFNKYIEDIHEEFQNNELGSDEIITSLLKTLIIKILRIIHSTNSDQNTSISDKVKKYIIENFNRDISLTELANVVFVNPYHLAHTFKNETGISPIQYLITHRIEVAKTMLLSTNLPIREIAFNVGYPNANYFNLLFKKFTGHSPGKFRKKFNTQ